MSVSDADFGYPAWRGFISWAYEQPEMRAAFTADTGISWPSAPKNGLDAMIDKATGHREKQAEAFAVWASDQYGEEFCPPAMQEAIKKARKLADATKETP